MQVEKQQNKRRTALSILIAVPVVCLLLVAVSALSNLGAPTRSPVIDRLDELQMARLSEAEHLRQSLGDAVWPGLGQADIPIVVWNEEYAFLVGLQDPADGWKTFPQLAQHGGPWEIVPGETYNGQPYFRQLLTAGVDPQNFTVLVGENWASSLQTRDWMLISLSQFLKSEFGPLFPYRWFSRQMLNGSDLYICALLHESFHAYQGLTAPARLEAGELANIQWHDTYPWEDKTLDENWQIEIETLIAALNAETDAETAALVREFLSIRAERRSASGLSQALVEFEKQFEWEEGLAKYVELAFWQQAYASSTYEPLPGLLEDPDFDQYNSFPRRWKSELSTFNAQTGDPDVRFYYTGMAQAFLLDRLMPDWKALIFEEGVWLEDLLAEAVIQ